MNLKLKIGDKVRFFPGDAVWTIKEIKSGPIEMLLVHEPVSNRTIELLGRNVFSMVASV